MPPGTNAPAALSAPPLKRWAIIGRPYATR